MATIKSFTSLEQSKKLAKILPLESADMTYYAIIKDWQVNIGLDIAIKENLFSYRNGYMFPCWSLAALLDVLPDGTDIIKDKTDTENEKYMCTIGVKDDIICKFGNNPVDACVDMILKLKERNLL